MRCPAIVDKGLFERVKASLPKKRTDNKRNTRRSYLLQGLIFCGECGKLFYSDTSHGKRVYCCSVVRSRGKEAGHEGLRTRYSADYLEGAILTWICRTVWPQTSDASPLSDFTFTVADDPASAEFETTIARFDAALTDIAAKRERVLDQASEGFISGSDLADALGEVAWQKEQTEQARERAQAGPKCLGRMFKRKLSRGSNGLSLMLIQATVRSLGQKMNSWNLASKSSNHSLGRLSTGSQSRTRTAAVVYSSKAA